MTIVDVVSLSLLALIILVAYVTGHQTACDTREGAEPFVDYRDKD